MKLLATTLSAALLLCLTGCGTFGRSVKVQLDDFGNPELYSRAVPGTSAVACDASRRVLLGQGYILEDERPSSFKAHKNFQPNPDAHIQVRFTVTCAANSKGSNTSTVFANAVKDRYSLRKSSNSASVGLGAIGSFSLPLTSSDDAMVKVASETISTQKFYSQFFAAIDRHLDASAKAEEADLQDDEEVASTSAN